MPIWGHKTNRAWWWILTSSFAMSRKSMINFDMFLGCFGHLMTNINCGSLHKLYTHLVKPTKCLWRSIKIARHFRRRPIMVKKPWLWGFSVIIYYTIIFLGRRHTIWYARLSNMWWIPNLVIKGFCPEMRMSSSTRQFYDTTQPVW